MKIPNNKQILNKFEQTMDIKEEIYTALSYWYKI